MSALPQPVPRFHGSSARAMPRRAALKVFSDEDRGDSTLTPEMTLSAFFEEYVITSTPVQDSEPRNIETIRTTIGHWKAATGDPAVGAIDGDVLDTFVDYLRKLPGRKAGEKLATSTLVKHCVEYNRVARFLGPGSRYQKQRYNTGLLGEAPLLDVPARPMHRSHKEFEIVDIGRLLGACVVIKGRKILGLPRSQWFRLVIEAIYYTGLRWQEFALYTPAWRRDEWLIVPESAAKTGDRREVYLHEEARRALDELGQRPCPFDRRWLYDCWDLLRAALKWPHDNRCFHGLRRTLYTQLSRLNSDAAKLMLGHRGVSIEYYAGRELMREFVPRIPVLRVVALESQRQTKLF